MSPVGDACQLKGTTYLERRLDILDRKAVDDGGEDRFEVIRNVEGVAAGQAELADRLGPFRTPDAGQAPAVVVTNEPGAVVDAGAQRSSVRSHAHIKSTEPFRKDFKPLSVCPIDSA